jgi:hypothetical protein
VNADINGAGNSIRKVAPDAFQQVEGVEDGKGVLASLVVHPVMVVVPLTKPEESILWRKQAVNRTLNFARKRYVFWNYSM